MKITPQKLLDQPLEETLKVLHKLDLNINSRRDDSMPLTLREAIHDYERFRSYLDDSNRDNLLQEHYPESFKFMKWIEKEKENGLVDFKKFLTNPSKLMTMETLAKELNAMIEAPALPSQPLD